jgi:archaellum component FlaG (FlaF/FlaG flagellin family)
MVTADNSGEQSYTVAISKPGRNTTTFTLNDIDTLVDTDAQKPSYVGDPSGIAGIRTWLVKKQTSTKSSVSSLQIMVSSSGGWIIRSGTPGTVSCEISAQK